MIRSVVKLVLMLCVVAVFAAAASGDGTYSYGDPTDAEQYMLELINIIRADPGGAAASYGIDLNEGLPAGTISDEAKQPLAMNSKLLAAARGHADDILVRDFFDHVNPDGLSPSDRAELEGYSPYVGENIALASVADMSEAEGVEYLLELLFVDEGIDGRGHRINLLRSTFSEAGIGFTRGDYETYDVYVVAQNFGSDNGPFATGICYSDVIDGGEFDLGEGVAGVTVVAGDGSTTSAAAGGYAILVTGMFSITAEGSGISESLDNVTVSTDSVKVDFTPAGIPDLPAVDDNDEDQDEDDDSDGGGGCFLRSAADGRASLTRMLSRGTGR